MQKKVLYGSPTRKKITVNTSSDIITYLLGGLRYLLGAEEELLLGTEDEFTALILHKPSFSICKMYSLPT